MDDEDARDVLRRSAGLSQDGSATDVKVWRESGPNYSPTFTELLLDLGVNTWAELGVAHGNVLVVQEHPSRLPKRTAAANDWL